MSLRSRFIHRPSTSLAFTPQTMLGGKYISSSPQCRWAEHSSIVNHVAWFDRPGIKFMVRFPTRTIVSLLAIGHRHEKSIYSFMAQIKPDPDTRAIGQRLAPTVVTRTWCSIRWRSLTARHKTFEPSYCQITSCNRVLVGLMGG